MDWMSVSTNKTRLKYRIDQTHSIRRWPLSVETDGSISAWVVYFLHEKEGDWLDCMFYLSLSLLHDLQMPHVRRLILSILLTHPPTNQPAGSQQASSRKARVWSHWCCQFTWVDKRAHVAQLERQSSTRIGRSVTGGDRDWHPKHSQHSQRKDSLLDTGIREWWYLHSRRGGSSKPEVT